MKCFRSFVPLMIAALLAAVSTPTRAGDWKVITGGAWSWSEGDGMLNSGEGMTPTVQVLRRVGTGFELGGGLGYFLTERWGSGIWVEPSQAECAGAPLRATVLPVLLTAGLRTAGPETPSLFLRAGPLLVHTRWVVSDPCQLRDPGSISHRNRILLGYHVSFGADLPVYNNLGFEVAAARYASENATVEGRTERGLRRWTLAGALVATL